MAAITVLSGSPSVTSRTGAVLDLLALRLVSQGHEVRTVAVRDLPATALMSATTTDPAIEAAVGSVSQADGVIVASPVYKAAYSGLLKCLLDLMPQYALAGKSVLPMVTGGTVAHVLAVDYALRPVLASMGAYVGQGYFLLDKLVTVHATGGATIAPEAERPLVGIVDAFAEALSLSRPVTVSL